MTVLDVAIVGAGPAGLAAATARAERGLSGPAAAIERGVVDAVVVIAIPEGV